MTNIYCYSFPTFFCLTDKALLSAPNPDDPLANDVASQWKSDEAKAIATGDQYRSYPHLVDVLFSAHL